MRTLRRFATLAVASATIPFGFTSAAPAGRASKPAAPAVPPGWEVKLVEAPREIGLGTMSVNVWARVGRQGAEPLPGCVLVLKDERGTPTYVDMKPVDGAMDAPAEEVVASIDTYTWVREGAHSWEIRANTGTDVPTVLAHGAIRVKPRVSTPDLVLLDQGGLVQPWVGSGAGGFTPGASVETGAPGGEPMIVDFDGDRLLDLAVPTRDGSLQLLLNGGNGRLEPDREIPLPLDLAASAIGDVDGDGAPDLVTASASGTLEIRFSLADDPSASVGLPSAPDCLQVADLDGNGAAEIYVGSVGLSDGEIQVVRRTAEGDWTVAGSLPPPEGGRGRIREMQRVLGGAGRGNGLLVLSAREGEATLESWGSRADTGTEPGLRTSVRLAGEPIGMTCGRFLGPGAPPVRIVMVHEGRGAELIAIGADDVPRKVGSIDKAPEAIVALDLDGDGDDDLATAADDLRLWINVGGAEFREAGESPYLLEHPVIALSSGSLDERIP